MDIASYIKSIINEEIDALEGLKKNIQPNIELIVQQILQCKGRLIVGGIGKSANIAHKIVATLNSTGTKASFLHASDAIHGDLGMIQNNDLVLLISKSGESPEIINLIPFIKKLGNQIIAMVGNPNSTLAKEAHLILNTSIEKEAGPHHLAPTSSTTCQLVLGDAIAMTLMKMKNFSIEDFSKYHPGGALGKKLLKTVKEIIKPEQNPQVLTNNSIQETIFVISKGRLGATAVLNQFGILEGIITDGDLRRALEKELPLSTTMASTIMNKSPKTILENSLASVALEIMYQHDITQLVVLNQSKNYVGILHLHDVLKEGIQLM